MERLTERTADGIVVKEDYGEKVLKTIYECYGAEPAPHYANCAEGYCAMEKLAYYEDLEEKGLLIKLPCKIGDVIYKVPSNVNYGINIVNRHEENNRVYRQEVCRIEISSSGTFSLRTCNGLDGVVSVSFGETWFLKEDEAEAKLKELEELNKHLKQAEQTLKNMEGTK